MSSPQKRERELKKLIEDVGLVIVSREISGSGHLKLKLEAPNGVTAPFVIAHTSSDHRAIKNEEARMRRFFRENSPPESLAQPRTVRPLWPPLGSVPLSVPLIDVVVIDEATPFKKLEPYQKQFLDTLTRKPAFQSALTESLTNMTTENTAPNPAADKPVKNQLARKEFHALCKWVAANVPNGREITHVDLRAEAGTALNLVVAESTMRDALECEERTLGEVKRTLAPHDRAHTIASELARLMKQLGVEPNAALVAIVERRPIAR